ncbi:hypothetical protein QN224_25570 [Sinorhizobium sp. 8-89]|uniref:hypothetical protein n=1 Tax=Sinorhizobium sp. 7-81 TaxID=3049087 RepID=UPI0024C3157D|nr:hypothetical protein [Sinorhizobium sp. 7-81]MDK1388777.1 hypothetical protein [Sinorhizobium sp. 7-81]
MQSRDERVDSRSPTERSNSMQKELPDRQIDPSESVTLFAIAFGAIGGLIGLVAAIILLPDSGEGTIFLNCLIAFLAGGSAGLVAGGTLGAALGVFRGVRAPKVHGQ